MVEVCISVGIAPSSSLHRYFSRHTLLLKPLQTVRSLNDVLIHSSPSLYVFPYYPVKPFYLTRFYDSSSCWNGIDNV